MLDKILVDAMYNGFVTVISYVRANGVDYITGQTFNHGAFVEQWNGTNSVK